MQQSTFKMPPSSFMAKPLVSKSSFNPSIPFLQQGPRDVYITQHNTTRGNFLGKNRFSVKSSHFQSKMAAANASVFYQVGLMAGCKQVTAKTELCTTARKSYILHDVTHNAHGIVHNVLRGELHDSKPGIVSDCSRCRHMHRMKQDVFVSDSRETLKPMYRDSSVVQVVSIH